MKRIFHVEIILKTKRAVGSCIQIILKMIKLPKWQWVHVYRPQLQLGLTSQKEKKGKKKEWPGGELISKKKRKFKICWLEFIGYSVFTIGRRIYGLEN